jgi:hypothetical protein
MGKTCVMHEKEKKKILNHIHEKKAFENPETYIYN